MSGSIQFHMQDIREEKWEENQYVSLPESATCYRHHLLTLNCEHPLRITQLPSQ